MLGCAKPPPRGPDPAEAVAELWVDAFAGEGGDGGRASPLKRVPALSGPTTLHLRSGLYRGAFSFPGGTTVEGHGEVVLFDEGTGVVVAAEGALTLRGLSVQGAAVGVRAAAPLVLERVKFSGHRVAGVELVDAGVTGHHLDFEARSDGTVGLSATRATVQLSEVTARGPLAVVVSGRDAQVELRGVKSEGPATAVQTLGGALVLERLDAAAGLRAAVLLANTRAVIRDSSVTAHEYAVLGRGGEVTLERVSSRGARAGGVSLLQAKVVMDAVTVERAGTLGSVQLLSCDSRIGALTIRDATATGLMVRQGTASIESLVVRGVRGEAMPGGELTQGDALQVRDATVSVARLEAEGVDGAGLSATNYATVTAGTVEVVGFGTAAVLAERKSVVTAEVVNARGGRGPALAVPEDGRVTVGTLSAQGADVAVWADCDSASLVVVKTAAQGTELPRLRCLLRASP